MTRTPRPKCLECRESPTGRCSRHRAPLPPELELPDFVGGLFYERTPEGRIAVIGKTAPVPPDLWICRRVADYPGGQIPIGAAVASCVKCGASIAFNPARDVQAPKVCMQCWGIQPLAIENVS